jgi:hypothetical protein
MYADRLCKEGRFEKAKAYCAAKGLPWPPFPGRDVPAESPVVVASADTNSAEVSTSVVVAPVAEMPVAVPTVTLAEHAAEPVAYTVSTAVTYTGSPAISGVQLPEVPRCTERDAGVGTPAPVLAKTDPAGGSRDERLYLTLAGTNSNPDLEPGENRQEPTAPLEAESLPPNTAHASSEAGRSFAESTADATAVALSETAIALREAVVTHTCLNPRLVGIEFANGERASMWKPFKNRRRYDQVKVRLAPGETGPNAIWEEVAV